MKKDIPECPLCHTKCIHIDDSKFFQSWINVRKKIAKQVKKPFHSELLKDIQNHSKRVAAPYKYPREIEFVEELPKTQSGKIMRKKLREIEKKKKRIVRRV